MNILYLHQYFKTDESNGGTRSYEFVKGLVDAGHKVTIISGLDAQVDHPNITYISTQTNYNQKMGKVKRILSFLNYSIKATIIGRKQQFDRLIATSTPLTVGVPAILISRKKKKPLIFEVRDVWPDIPIELGYIRSKVLIKILKKFEKMIYKNASHIVALSTGMKDNIVNKGFQKVTVIENMAMTNRFTPGKPEGFVCIHHGAMGPVNDLGFVLDVSKHLVEYPQIKIKLIGEGSQKSKLIERIKIDNIHNVEVIDAIPKKDVIDVVRQASIGLMIVNNSYEILNDNSANKFFDYLSCGLPVLINYQGWQKDILEQSNSGFSCLTSEKFAEKIIELYNNADLHGEISKNSRKLAEEKFSRDELTSKFINIVVGDYYVYKNKE